MMYLFYGADAFLVRAAAAAVRARFKSTHTMTIIDCARSEKPETPGSLIAHIGTPDLFASQRMIIVRDVFAGFDAEGQAAVRDFLETWSDDATVLIFEETSLPRKNARLFTWFRKNVEVVECVVPTGSHLIAWVRDYITTEGATVSTGALRMIVEQHAPDQSLSRIAHLCDQLIAYVDGGEIPEDAVGLLARSRVQADIFATIEAASAGQRQRALRLIQAHIAAGDDPHYIFSMYVYHVRTLLSVAGLYHDQGIRDKTQIARELKIHPFVAQKSMSALAKIEKKKLLQAFTFLKDSDVAIKRGAADIAVVLERFVWIF